jgi:hypothetical protein
MALSNSFIENLERTIRTQLKSRRVGYLLGAGASYLNGQGYPLANNIWDQIKEDIPEKERKEIQEKLNLEGTEGIEHALDLLDPGGPEPTSHRTMVTTSIANLFSEIKPPIEQHSKFLRNVSRRSDNFIPIFTLNYDPLIELAADGEKIPAVDGFTGFYKASFDPNIFDVVPSKYYMSRKGRVLSGNHGILHIYKLHGSMGWFSVGDNQIRVNLSCQVEDNWRRLMIPPQYRKATETTTPPYSALWTRYRAWMVHGPMQLNRLICVGYGMKDQHVNDVIENAISRLDFTLLIFAKELTNNAFEKWAKKKNVVIVTQDRCSHFGEQGPGHTNLWDFDELSREV